MFKGHLGNPSLFEICISVIKRVPFEKNINQNGFFSYDLVFSLRKSLRLYLSNVRSTKKKLMLVCQQRFVISIIDEAQLSVMIISFVLIPVSSFQFR